MLIDYTRQNITCLRSLNSTFKGNLLKKQKGDVMSNVSEPHSSQTHSCANPSSALIRLIPPLPLLSVDS